jgi:hypothetical protein
MRVEPGEGWDEPAIVVRLRPGLNVRNRVRSGTIRGPPMTPCRALPSISFAATLSRDVAIVSRLSGSTPSSPWCSLYLSNATVFGGELAPTLDTSKEFGGGLVRPSIRPREFGLSGDQLAGERLREDGLRELLGAGIEARSRITTWAVGRKHLSSSFVRCGLCGSGISITASMRSAQSSYCCTKARAKGCEGIGYRVEHHVDAAVIGACMSLVTDEVLERTREIIQETLDVRRQVETHEAEHARLEREVATAERRIKGTQELVLDSDGAEREHHRASLRDQLARLERLKSALVEVKASPTPTDAKTVLKELEERVLGLRELLARGRLEALPAVQAILGGERFTATKIEGGWHLEARVSSVYLFDKAGRHQKARIKGSVPEPPAGSAP